MTKFSEETDIEIAKNCLDFWGRIIQEITALREKV